MIKNFMIYLCVLWAVVVAAGCTNEDTPIVHTSQGDIKVMLSRASNVSVENEIVRLDAILFNPDGTFREAFRNVTVVDDKCRLLLNYQDKSVLVFLANSENLVNLDELIEEKVSLELLKEQTVRVLAENKTQLFMTGELELNSGSQDLQVTLTRGVARIDLVKAPETQVYEISVTGLVKESYLFPQSSVKKTDETYSYHESSQSGDIQGGNGLLYVWEQSQSDEALVTAKVSISGVNHILTQKLPAMARNNVYTIRIKGTGIDAGLEIEENLWEDGDQYDAESSGKIWIENPSAEENVTFSGNDVYVSYLGTKNASFTLKMDNGSIVRQEGGEGLVTIAPVENGDYLVSMNSKALQPGVLGQMVYLKIYSSDESAELLGNVKIHFDENPLKVRGNLVFDDHSTFDAKTYIDGELGELILPDGYTLRVDAPAYSDEDAQWLKAFEKEEENNVYRIVAGWRPNDIKAKGECQTARLYVEDATGHVDILYIKRLNWSLPVVNINDVWWCKYNLRGNVKRFEDQISVAEDQKISEQGDFASYLSSCSDEEFLRLAGDQYIGGKADGLTLAADSEGKLYYEGYNSSEAVDFGSIPATQMAPEGYQIPTYNNYRFFTNSNSLNMGYGGNVFNNGMNGTWSARLRYNMFYRELKTDDLNYGDVTVYKFWKEANPAEEWVLFGLGHQWADGANNVSPMYILFAISDRTGNTWAMEGHPQGGSGNIYKYSAQNYWKTRMIRCIKTPVEFTY